MLSPQHLLPPSRLPHNSQFLQIQTSRLNAANSRLPDLSSARSKFARRLPNGVGRNRPAMMRLAQLSVKMSAQAVSAVGTNPRTHRLKHPVRPSVDLDRQRQRAIAFVDLHGCTIWNFPAQQLVGERILQIALDSPLKGTRAIYRIITHTPQPCFRLVG